MENPSHLPPLSLGGPHDVRLISPKLDQLVYCRFLGAYRGLITHWARKRTTVCPGASLCPPADHRLRSVWRGYAPVELWLPAAACWRAGVLELTESAEEKLRGRTLRGEVWAFLRTGATQEKSRVEADYCERLASDQLRSPFDVDPILKRFYRVLDLPRDTENPLPTKVRLADVAGPGPARAGTSAAPLDPEQSAPIARKEAAAAEKKAPASKPTAEQWQKLRKGICGIGKE